MILSQVQFFDKLINLGNEIPTVRTNKKVTFYNIPCGFDIETSSFYVNDEKQAIMYEWTFGIGLIGNDSFNTYITAGRTWEEFYYFINTVATWLECNPVSRRLVCYVHNLPYEWQFIRKRFTWDKIFLIDDRKPVYAITDTGIEFRCSLKLSGKSLANTAKDLMKYKTEKLSGELDYEKIRHSETPLTEREWAYCEHDVKVMLSYIQEKIEQDGDISRIPLTKTGYVRRYCKKCCFPETEELLDVYAELRDSTEGISGVERSFRRRVYPRQSEVGKFDSEEDWFVRLYEFISRCDDSGKVSNVIGKIHRRV